MSNTVVIDGFTVNTESNFKYNKEYLENRYKEFNERYFGGELPKIKLGIVTTKNGYLGITGIRCSFNKNNGLLTSLSEVTIDMNDFYDRSEKTVCSVFIHEMIHVWEATIMRSVPKHESLFKKKMSEINSKTEWGVSITETAEEYESRGSAPQSRLDNIKENVYFGALKLIHDKFFTFLFNKKDFHTFEPYFTKYEGSKVYKIIDPRSFVESRVCRTKPNGDIIPSGTLQAMVNVGRIEEVDPWDSNTQNAVYSDIKKKARKIEKDCYLAVSTNKYFDAEGYKNCFLIKKDISNDLFEYLVDRQYDIYNIIVGVPFVDKTICGTLRKVAYTNGTNFKITNEDLEDYISQYKIAKDDSVLYESKDNGDRLNESTSLTSYIERDPFTDVKGIKKIDDNTVEINLTIS